MAEVRDALLALERDLSTVYDRLTDETARVESARAAAVALEQECAVLTDALALFTHEYQAQVIRPGHCHCGLRADNIQHRTPAFLRKRYGLGV